MGRLVRRLHFLLASAVGGVALTVSCTAGLLLIPLVGPRRAVFAAARLFSRVTLLSLGWRLSVTGRERLLVPGPAVVAVRHQSALDVALCAALIPSRSVGIGKKELLRVPFLGWLWAASGNFLVDRSDLASAIASMREAAERVRRDGLLLWVAPEGRRNVSRQLAPMKKGPFHLALAGPFPVLPVAVEPLDALFSARGWLARPGRVRIEVLPPVVPAEGESADALAARFAGALASAQDALARDAGLPLR